MKVFITGCTGMLGSNLVRALVSDGHEVVGLCRSIRKAQWLLHGLELELIAGDMRDVNGFAHHLEGCDAVIHTAAYFREYYTPGDHADALEDINVRAMIALMRASEALGVKRFIHIGSSSAIGMKPDGSPGDEDTAPAPEQLRNLYARSKFEGDAKIREFQASSNMRVIEILPGWMWGPGDAGPTGAGKLLLDFLAGKLPAVPKGGTNVADVRDVAAAIVAALHHPAPRDRYLVGGTFHTIPELMHTIAKITGRRPPRALPSAVVLAYAHCSELWARLTGTRPTAPVEGVRLFARTRRVSSARAIAELGASFRPFAETAEATMTWYREHGVYEPTPPAKAVERPAVDAARP